MPFQSQWALAALLTALVGAASGPSLAQEAVAMPSAFRMCAGCHAKTADQKGAVGPYLGGVVGRMAGSYPGFEYSEALVKSGLTWDEATLRKFLMDPPALVPDTKKVIAVKNPATLDNIVAYLKTLK